MPYYVYILLCEGGSFYTGCTRNMKSRVRLHMTGRGARYTRMHKPKRLIYTEEFGSRSEAMKRERRLKRMGHDEKSRLVRSKVQEMQKARKRKHL